MGRTTFERVYIRQAAKDDDTTSVYVAQGPYSVTNNKILSVGRQLVGPSADTADNEYFAIDVSGNITSSQAQTDRTLFAGAQNWVQFSSGAASVLTRLAGGNLAWVQAASVTVQYVLDISGFIEARTTAGKGFKLTSFDMIYLPITASLTSITPTLYKTTYANNTAAVIASTGAGLDITAGTNTLTVPSTGPWVFNQAVTTPAFWNPSGDQILQLEVVIVTPGTAVPNFYGCYLNFNEVIF